MVTKKRFVPDRGDVVRISFDPPTGRGRAGKRPAVVLSPRRYNEVVGSAIMCPITSKHKAYPLEVVLPSTSVVKGAVPTDHVRSLDLVGRKATYREALPKRTIREILATLNTVIGDQR
ncbi:endoribonuclease MazF [soil metagenome]